MFVMFGKVQKRFFLSTAIIEMNLYFIFSSRLSLSLLSSLRSQPHVSTSKQALKYRQR